MCIDPQCTSLLMHLMHYVHIPVKKQNKILFFNISFLPRAIDHVYHKVLKCESKQTAVSHTDIVILSSSTFCHL